MIVTILTRSKVMLIHLLYDLPSLCSILHITGPNEAKTGEIEVLPMLRSRCSRVSSPIIFDQRSVTDPAHFPPLIFSDCSTSGPEVSSSSKRDELHHKEYCGHFPQSVPAPSG